MALHFYNTMGGKVEEFRPLEDKKVRIYTCGLTVYGYAHIGNYRTFVFQDILRRFLKYQGYQVVQAMNLTDVDDKTIRNADAAGLSLRDYTDRFIEAFEVDRQLLNLEKPEFVVRATDHIDDMVKLVQKLEQKGYAYKSEGSYYFPVEKFPDYGKLSRIDLSGIRAGARVDADEYDKANVRDFVLWKAAKEGEPFWDTALGPGRPGWHIECSAMSMKYLGETFDIHSGGIDLVFPHHENEIAQSEAATGKPFVRFWLHGEHLVVNGEKMSKSLGNVYTLRDLIAKGYRPTAIRYLLASVPFRSTLNFTFDGLHQARQSVERLRNFHYRLTKEEFSTGINAGLEELAANARRKFEEALADNLNTAEALAAIFEMVREGNTAMDHGKFLDGNRGAFLDTLARWDQIFAVLEDNDQAKLREYGLLKGEQEVEPGEASEAGAELDNLLTETLDEEEIEKLLSERESARRQGNFARADQIRDELQNGGVLVEDTKAGTRWKRK
ncbi:MAG: cysteine--tRNA ligase [Acidobacteria bacterium]|nr:MAG: cysteine--tRNA ligase [Acidobacteriota bacterium]